MDAGALLVHKSSGLTSHDVVEIVRRKLGVRRVGHTGTLDPMAEGLLVVLVGTATQHQAALQHHEKVYEGVVRFGTRTDTGDADGRPIATAPVPPLQRDTVESALGAFRGAVTQVPPAYSAVKVRGRPAYWWARHHTPVTLAARTVRIAELTLLEVAADAITLRIRCSAGTYIRTLAEAIAERLGTVGHVSRLVRTAVGGWTLTQAKPLSWIRSADPEAIREALVPVPVPSAVRS